MSRREQYMKALRGERSDELIWAPNFDHWYGVNTANGTIPREYRGLSCNDLLRAVGATIWRRVGLIQPLYDDSVKVETRQEPGRTYSRYVTPVGEIQTMHQQAPDSSKAWFLVEHWVKRVEDLRVLKYLIEATHHELRIEQYQQQLREVGDDGIVLTMMCCVPFIQLAKMDIGYQNAYYLLYDHPEAFQAVVDAYEKSYLDAFQVAAQSPMELFSTADNMDQLTCPPEYFKRYAQPFYRRMRDILHARGKIAAGHWCGRIDQLVELSGDCGLDVIEAATPRPMTNLDMKTMMTALEGKVAVQGGVPAVYMCPEGCTRDQLVKFVEELLEQVGSCRGFVLGMGDNVPPDADFARVKIVSELVEAYNRCKMKA